MADRTPAQELRDAAEKLRQLLTFLGDNRGPWYVKTGPTGYPQSIRNIGVPYVVADCFEGPEVPFAIVPYIATMHPGVAGPLASLLERTAIEAEKHGRGFGNYQIEIADEGWLELARAINGEAS